MTSQPPPNRNDEQADRSRGNLLGLVVAILLIVGGAYLIIELMDSIEYQKCAAAGRRNCDTIELKK